MPSADVVLFPPPTILLSVAGIQHGPHFDPIEIAFIFGVVISVAGIFLLGMGAGLGCAAAALIRGASYGKSVLIGMGVTTCAGLVLISNWFLFSSRSPLVGGTVVILAAVAILVILVHRSGDPSPVKRSLMGFGAIIGIGIALFGTSLIPVPRDSLPIVLTIILAATVIMVVFVHRIGLNASRL